MHRLMVRRSIGALATVLVGAAFAVVAARPALADGGSGGCNVIINPSCTVGTGGGGGDGADSRGGAGGGGGTDPCAPYPDAAYGSVPPAVSQACADELQGRLCSAIQADALGGLELPNWAAVPAAEIVTLNKLFVAQGCPPIVTTAALAQQAFATIVFPKPSGHRSPSETQLYRGFPMTWVNLWTYYWTDPSTWHDLTATASAAGLSATVTATPVALNFDPGDGSGAQGCAGLGRPWTDADGSSPPSNGACGYQYTRVTTAPITATETIVWQITWTGTGNTGGQIPTLSTSTSGQLNVLQIQAVNQ